MPNIQDMIGLLPTTDAYVLVDPRPDKQAFFNAGKIAEKLCDQQKNLQEATWEALVSDNEALIKSVTEGGKSDAAICKILGGIAVTNAVDNEDASAVFGAGYACSKSIKQIA